MSSRTVLGGTGVKVISVALARSQGTIIPTLFCKEEYHV